MEIPLHTLLGLLAVHWVADFVFQSRQMAENKSKSVEWLSIHVCVYTCFMGVFGWKFALITGVLHWITDFFTSKLSSYFHKRENIHGFFIVIGFDQLIHAVCLAYLWVLLNS